VLASGRGGAIRTLDLLNPIQVRYQAAPRPEGAKSTTGGPIDEPDPTPLGVPYPSRLARAVAAATNAPFTSSLWR